MKRDPVEELASSLLYEGYLLYPYRRSSLKNQKPWAFGTIEPGGFQRTECLVAGDESARVHVTHRFLLVTPEGVVERRIEETIAPQVGKVSVELRNTTGESYLSAHAILRVTGGRFISLLEPEEEFAEAAAQCRNVGTWPVLVGTPGAGDVMLSSPIILYDYPRLAPESAGPLFDNTEIDEILTLRILTLTPEEKAEMRLTDPRARELLDRTEGLTSEELLRMHGTVTAGAFSPGDRVRLRPVGRADIFDIVLEGKSATVESVAQDFEGRRFVSVTVDDDPGRDLGREAKAGHRFYFREEEVEAL